MGADNRFQKVDQPTNLPFSQGQLISIHGSF